MVVGEDRLLFYFVAALVGAVPGAALGGAGAVAASWLAPGPAFEVLGVAGALKLFLLPVPLGAVAGGYGGFRVLRWWFERRDRSKRVHDRDRGTYD